MHSLRDGRIDLEYSSCGHIVTLRGGTGNKMRNSEDINVTLAVTFTYSPPRPLFEGRKYLPHIEKLFHLQNNVDVLSFAVARHWLKIQLHLQRFIVYCCCYSTRLYENWVAHELEHCVCTIGHIRDCTYCTHTRIN